MNTLTPQDYRSIAGAIFKQAFNERAVGYQEIESSASHLKERYRVECNTGELLLFLEVSHEVEYRKIPGNSSDWHCSEEDHDGGFETTREKFELESIDIYDSAAEEVCVEFDYPYMDKLLN